MPVADPVMLRKPDLLEEMADCLQRGQRLLEQAQVEHARVMAIYRRLSSEAKAIADQINLGH